MAGEGGVVPSSSPSHPHVRQTTPGGGVASIARELTSATPVVRSIDAVFRSRFDGRCFLSRPRASSFAPPLTIGSRTRDRRELGGADLFACHRREFGGAPVTDGAALRAVVGGLARALGHCHAHGLAHRDVKVGRGWGGGSQHDFSSRARRALDEERCDPNPPPLAILCLALRSAPPGPPPQSWFACDDNHYGALCDDVAHM